MIYHDLSISSPLLLGRSNSPDLTRSRGQSRDEMLDEPRWKLSEASQCPNFLQLITSFHASRAKGAPCKATGTSCLQFATECHKYSRHWVVALSLPTAYRYWQGLPQKAHWPSWHRFLFKVQTTWISLAGLRQVSCLDSPWNEMWAKHRHVFARKKPMHLVRLGIEPLRQCATESSMVSTIIHPIPLVSSNPQEPWFSMGIVMYSRVFTHLRDPWADVYFERWNTDRRCLIARCCWDVRRASLMPRWTEHWRCSDVLRPGCIRYSEPSMLHDLFYWCPLMFLDFKWCVLNLRDVYTLIF